MKKLPDQKEIPQEKISPGFAARLVQLGPDEKVRAIVLLDTARTQKAMGRRLTKTSRRTAIKNTRQLTSEALPEIDRILKRHDGKRLKTRIDALSAVPVVTTPAGIDALTDSKHVRAIFEDQALFRVA